MPTSSAEESPAKSRLAHELRSYVVVSAYLFVCFSVILFYETSQTAGPQSSAIGIGAALVKALVIGKFILIGELLKPGTRVEAPTLLHRVAWRTLGMLIVLIVLRIVEELVIGAVHGQGVAATFDELLRHSWRALLGPTMLMLLILIPLMTAIELDRALGHGGLRNLMLRRS